MAEKPDTKKAQEYRAKSAMRHASYMRNQVEKIKARKMGEQQRILWLEKKVQSLETKLKIEEKKVQAK